MFMRGVSGASVQAAPARNDCSEGFAPIEPDSMTQTSIASWNINSVRARIGIVEKFLREEAPDVLCLQETKVCLLYTSRCV